MRKALSIIALICCGLPTWASAGCPDLSALYAGNSGSSISRSVWEGIHTQLLEIFDQCLLSSEYFALYGAAQLNTDRLTESMESLERSLLLNPDNGAALTDYAEALLRDGQLFAAIEANSMLLGREDVPEGLEPQIKQRQHDWGTLTRQTSWQLDLLGGYDDNLNGAPDEELITLTLSGEPILLKLNEEFQAVHGPFMNARLMGRHRRLTPDSQHSFMGQVRGRLSEDAASDALQVAGRYDQDISAGRSNLQWGVGLNHLLFSGRPLFTATDARYRVQFSGSRRCMRYASGALQHQVWHEQRRLDGVEIKAGFGADCLLGDRSDQRFNLEGSVLHNTELNDNRLGGSRNGWQLIAGWRMALSRGILSAQLNYTQLLDEQGISPLLQNNARRVVRRGSVVVQYRERINWLGDSTQFLLNLYHQNQNSNLGLYETEDTSFEVGLSWQF